MDQYYNSHACGGPLTLELLPATLRLDAKQHRKERERSNTETAVQRSVVRSGTSKYRFAEISLAVDIRKQ